MMQTQLDVAQVLVLTSAIVGLIQVILEIVKIALEIYRESKGK